MFLIFFSVLALEASLGGVAGGGLGAESTFDRNNLGQVFAITYLILNLISNYKKSELASGW